jgi:hypothetical protein
VAWGREGAPAAEGGARQRAGGRAWEERSGREGGRAEEKARVGRGVAAGRAGAECGWFGRGRKVRRMRCQRRLARRRPQRCARGARRGTARWLARRRGRARRAVRRARRGGGEITRRLGGGGGGGGALGRAQARALQPRTRLVDGHHLAGVVEPVGLRAQDLHLQAARQRARAGPAQAPRAFMGKPTLGVARQTMGEPGEARTDAPRLGPIAGLAGAAAAASPCHARRARRAAARQRARAGQASRAAGAKAILSWR